MKRNLKRGTVPMMHIGGRLIDIYLARIVYRCADCLGELERHGFGLRCISNHKHNGFIHRDEAAEKKQQEKELFNELAEIYEIVDGQIVAKEK